MPGLRISTSVLLTRRSGQELEVYLVERAPTLRFFGGYWAFPGGVVEPIDHEDGPDGEATHRRCALRELFEETGVLPAELARSLLQGERARLRDALLEEPEPPARWRELLDRHPAVPGVPRPFARLTTPPFSPVRHRTRFVHVELPEGEEPVVVPGELVAGRFQTPRAALDRWLAGEQLVVPPVLSLLEGLERAGLERFLTDAEGECEAYARGRLPSVRSTPGVRVLPLATPTLPPATTTNCYVVGTERLYVVDPATYDEGERARLFEFLDAELARGARIEAVLATHHHADHVGSIAGVCERYGVPVHAHARTLERLPAGFRRGRALADGERLELGDAPDGRPGWALHALFTPGHDRGHLAFREDRYDALVAGDLVSTMSTIVIDPPEGHLATYLASLERVLAGPLGVLYPAHGPAHPRGKELLRHYLDHRARREEALVATLDAGRATIDELLPEVYADTDRALWPLAARSLRAGLDKLEEEGRAERAGERWRRR